MNFTNYTNEKSVKEFLYRAILGSLILDIYGFIRSSK